MDGNNSITLYGTDGCHLCEQAEGLLQYYSEWSLIKIDIAEDENLMALYGVRIPVLKHNKSQAELGWVFDFDSLGCWLETLK